MTCAAGCHGIDRADGAGLGGFGGSSYSDSVVLRDRGANTDWVDESDGTLEERRYYCQNWRHDVVAGGAVLAERREPRGCHVVLLRSTTARGIYHPFQPCCH
jgi:hypothetical protein